MDTMDDPPIRRSRFMALLFTATTLLLLPLLIFIHISTPASSHPLFAKPKHSLLSLDTTSNPIILERRASASASQKYQVTGLIGDGLYSQLTFGSSKQPVLFSVDTSFPYLLVNNYTLASNASAMDQAIGGFLTSNSTSFVNTQGTFNVSNVDSEYAYGDIVSDTVYFNDTALSDPLTFGLTLNSSINLKNKNVVGGHSPKIVIQTNSTNTNKSMPVNILGLNLVDDAYSFLNQIIAANISTTRLFSIYLNQNNSPVILFGAVDTTQYDGPLYMTPILEVMDVNASVDTVSYKYPFVTMSGITLVNYEHSTSLNLSSNPLSIPVLMDTSNVMSYLPYSLLVDLASQFGAYFSSQHSIWIQSCSFMSVNGSVGFQFYDVTVQIPLSDLFVPLINSNGESLYLESGDLACALAFSPAEARGFSSLGAPFFQSAYVVFDYTNKYVGISQSYLNEIGSDTPDIVVVNDEVGNVVNATTMSAPSGSPTAVLEVPQSSYKLYASSEPTIDADKLLTSPPASSSTTVASSTTASVAPSTTKAGNAVSVTSGSIFEAGASAIQRPNHFIIIAFSLFLLLIV